MNYNEQMNHYPHTAGGRRLIKRPLETPGLETNPNSQQIFNSTSNSNLQFTRNYANNSFQSSNQFPPAYPPTVNLTPNEYQSVPQSGFNPAQSSFNNPIVANMAMYYGQALAGAGHEFVDKEIEKYVPVKRLKYYFAVDTSYVSKKLSVILFPYMHSDWSIKYDQNEPIQPKFEVNAPDLYIPTMAFLTYILVIGLVLGTKNQFTPEKLSMEASHALAWSGLEVVVQLIMLYLANINTNLKTLDIIAYSSYKYVGIVITMLINLLFGHIGYIVSVIYVCVSIAFFMMRTLKLQILTEPVSSQPDMYGIPQPSVHQTGLKRRQYFLLFAAFSQIAIIWWLTSRVV